MLQVQNNNKVNLKRIYLWLSNFWIDGMEETKVDHVEEAISADGGCDALVEASEAQPLILYNLPSHRPCTGGHLVLSPVYEKRKEINNSYLCKKQKNPKKQLIIIS